MNKGNICSDTVEENLDDVNNFEQALLMLIVFKFLPFLHSSIGQTEAGSRMVSSVWA